MCICVCLRGFEYFGRCLYVRLDLDTFCHNSVKESPLVLQGERSGLNMSVRYPLTIELHWTYVKESFPQSPVVVESF